MSDHTRPPLRLIRGMQSPARIGTVRVAIAPPGKSPRVAAVVCEEDTWQIMSAGPELTAADEHPLRLLTRLLEAEPLAPGTVLVRQEDPLTLIAVIHDFGAEPCCRAEWVAAALAEVFRICRERRLRSLLLPLFGVRHGRLAPGSVISLVVRAIREGAGTGLQSVLLDVPPGREDEVRRLLSAWSRREAEGEQGDAEQA